MPVALDPEATAALAGPEAVPAWLQPLVATAASGGPAAATVQQIVSGLGFSSFSYGVTTAAQPRADERFHLLTTVPAAWVEEYDRRGYVEVDPRLRHGWNVVTPFLWDARIGGGDERVEAFLARAAAQGIGSGVTVFLRDAQAARVMLALNAAERLPPAPRRRELAERLGDYLLLGTILHACCARPIAPGSGSAPRGRPLSEREVQCLQLAARGQTSRDIAYKLGISARTASFHLSNALAKLAAANRSEAIAKAAALGVLGEDFFRPAGAPGRASPRATAGN